MSDQARLTALATALLRIALGVMFIAHSLVLKLLTFGLPATAAFFQSVGLPGWLGYVTFAAELIGGVMLILGVRARLAAAVLAPFMLGAAVTVHLSNGWQFAAPGGGWEYPAYLFVLCLAQVLLGDGAFALAPSTFPLQRHPAASATR